MQLERILSDDIQQRSGIVLIQLEMRENRLGWFGHIQRVSPPLSSAKRTLPRCGQMLKDR